MPRVSIIMPLYNGIDYIDECIESIKNQTYTDWEFIIVSEYGCDDGSSDRVNEYAKSDDRIILVQNKERLGLAESLNVGIEYAKGEFVARVDDDDPSYPTRFQKQVEFLDIHPEIGICGTFQESVTENGSSVLRVPFDCEELMASMIFGCQISHCSVMLRRTLFTNDKWRYDGTKLGEDFDLWTRMMFSTKFANLPEVLVKHRWGFGNISLEKGEKLKREVQEINARTLEHFDIFVKEENLSLLSGWRNLPLQSGEENICNFIRENYELLINLIRKNKQKQIINEHALNKVVIQRWNWGFDACKLKYRDLIKENIDVSEVIPEVSVIMPIFNNIYTIREAIDSILSQEFTNWELLIIYNDNMVDASFEVAKFCELFDKRIRCIQTTKMCVADFLNEGIKLSRGKYIARMTAFDISTSKRLRIQYEFLQNNQDVKLVQAYEKFIGNETNFVKRPPLEQEKMRIRMIFFNAIAEGSLMFRKEWCVQNNLWYLDCNGFEDYYFMRKVMEKGVISTIPDILMTYRIDKRYTNGKKSMSFNEILHDNIKDEVGISIRQSQLNYINPYYSNESDSVENLRRTQKILCKIYKKCSHKLGNKYLLETIAAIWRIKKYHNETTNRFVNGDIYDALEVSEVAYRHPYIYNVWKKWQKYIFKRNGMVIEYQGNQFNFYTEILQKKIESLLDTKLDNQFKKIDKQIERWTWKRYEQHLYYQNGLTEYLHKDGMVSYLCGEKIRVVFIIQVAAFYASASYLINEMLKNSDFEVKIVCYDENVDSTIKVDTTKKFLDDNMIPYEYYKDFSIDRFEPHIVFLQTPYDGNRADRYQSVRLYEKGYRIIYIPYGVEIADTESARKAHFMGQVVNHCWRIYTLSEMMRKDYIKYCPNGNCVVATGLPRFDALYHKENYPLDDMIRGRAGKRKIVLWKVHFPKVIDEKGKKVFVTPDLDEYIKFAEKLIEYKNFFFIFMPHPRFKEFNTEKIVQEKIERLFNLLNQNRDNIYIDDSDDYRNSLLNADYIIIDRSAVMVEAAVVQVPTLYMYNKKFEEPVTAAIAELMQSYYHGTTCDDMMKFLDNCALNIDSKREQRNLAMAHVLECFDGKCSERIIENIKESLCVEHQNIDNIEKIIDKKLEQRMDDLYNRLEKLITEKK